MRTLSDKLFLLALILTLSLLSCSDEPDLENFYEMPEEGTQQAIKGPYDVVTETGHGSQEYFIYRPASLESFGQSDTLPVVLWGNGGCTILGTAYTEFLTTLASHGFLIVTSNREGDLEAEVSPEEFIGGLDWAEIENQRNDSPLFNKIKVDRVAAMGQSCGGFLSFAAGADPRIDSVGSWNSGLGGNTLTARIQRIIDPRTGGYNALKRLHSPVLYIDGNVEDDRMVETQADFDVVDHVPVFYGSRLKGGHFGTLLHPGGGEFANVAVGWLSWQLKGDEVSERMFLGDDCELCNDPNWIVKRKGF